MRTIRLYLDLPLTTGATVTLPVTAADHAVRVLRLAAGAAITLFNGDGRDYPATLLDIGKRPQARVEAVIEPGNESPLALTLSQAVVRGEKMDLIVQKATELGVVRIVPLFTERSEVRLDAARARKRLDHWQSIAISACEQSGRARIPIVAAPLPLEVWLQDLATHTGARLTLLPRAPLRIRDVTFPTPHGALVVGPEGGLGSRDTAALLAADFAAVQLGPRILRTETAGLAALAALQSMHGDA